MRRLLDGYQRFRTEVFPRRRALFQRLAGGQTPEVLFIACADSRVVPEMITQTAPGEMFVCRNIGNIVPAYGEMLGGVSAVVEYAVTALGVSNIVVCGHSDCGAMKGLLDPNSETLQRMPTVVSWLRNAHAARSVVDATRPGLDDAARLAALVEENVALQLQHLRTHPAVAARLADGSLALQGWVYDIEAGEVAAYDEASKRLTPLPDGARRAAG